MDELSAVFGNSNPLYERGLLPRFNKYVDSDDELDDEVVFSFGNEASCRFKFDAFSTRSSAIKFRVFVISALHNLQ